MRNPPTGAELLETARAVLREELLNSLPSDKRYVALMIANAMSIAARQLENGDEPELHELASLAQLLGVNVQGVPDTSKAMRDELVALNRHLSRWIREGRADPGTVLHDTVRDHLRETMRQQVAESNPKYLKAAS